MDGGAGPLLADRCARPAPAARLTEPALRLAALDLADRLGLSDDETARVSGALVAVLLGTPGEAGLTPTEAAVWAVLRAAGGRIVPRAVLAEAVGGGDTNLPKVICCIRRKLGRGRIATHYGLGLSAPARSGVGTGDRSPVADGGAAVPSVTAPVWGVSSLNSPAATPSAAGAFSGGAA